MPAGDNLAAIAPDQLTLAYLRERFAQPNPQWESEQILDRTRLAQRSKAKAAAVLIPLIVAADSRSLNILLTTRPSHLRTHSGQIAFPGGGVDPDDDNRIATALREADEEVGLKSDDIEIIGQMPEYVTGTGFHVTPVIGGIHGRPELHCDPGEVDEVFEVPLPWLMDPNNHQRRHVTTTGEERTFYSMPWTPGNGEVEYFIWGVTAAILRNLFNFLRVK